MEGQEFHGVIVVNKPVNISSAQAVAVVKRLARAKKAGHTGTLDPLAEGVLVCCLNQATRIARFLLHGKKKYEAVLRLGVETDTQDATGAVTAVCETLNFAPTTLQSVFKRFEGAIDQQPPAYSALKHKGVPLYRLARCGHLVQKPPRKVHIASLEILDVKLPHVRFEVACSGGTYIRTLCADIGRFLGCGGHLQALKRIASSGFTIDQAVSLQALEKIAAAGKLPRILISMAGALPEMAEYTAGPDLIDRIRHGQTITTHDLLPNTLDEKTHRSHALIKIVDSAKELVAIINYHRGMPNLDYCCVFPRRDPAVGGEN
ncbi:MAG: tRNA pseudouridine(55) synthase TruB [Desulfobacterales bacterium]|nr:MAG: tRNA pseudouridine(55) synthase TruB [Desulfobacterales bacterium]